MILVRLLVFLVVAVIAVAFALFLVKRDRRYLRFIGQVFKFAIVMMLLILVFFAFERLVVMI